LPSKVIGHLRFGFASGFEAVALPRRHRPVIPGYARRSGLALQIYRAKGRTKGIAQKWKATSTAGHSHRLTSGGKAEAELAHNF